MEGYVHRFIEGKKLAKPPPLPPFERLLADRALHFIVRHDGYKQTVGYGHFLNYVLSQLNYEKPKTARALLERTATLMLNPPDKNSSSGIGFLEKNQTIFWNSLPKHLQSFFIALVGDIDKPMHEAIPEALKKVFGPAAHSDYGVLQHDRIEATEADVHKNLMTVKGSTIATMILYADGKHNRGYFDTLQKQYPELKPESIPEDFMMQFPAYPVPGGNETLPLMQISSPQLLEKDFASRYSGNEKIINTSIVPLFLGKDYLDNKGRLTQCKPGEKGKLIFLHPHCDRAYFDKLVKCIEPLLEQLDVPRQRGETTTPPDSKIEAMATIYWLLAQSTPVVRGGSGYANGILEHLANRLKEQGYDYTLPHTAKGVDLWANAAVLPLEDDDRVQGFKKQFKAGLFFDPQTKDEDIANYLHEHLPARDDAQAFRAGIVDTRYAGR